MKPLFGALNATLSKTIAANAPRYKEIVEPYGDGGTFALHIAKRRPQRHVLNIVKPELWAAMVFAQSGSRAQIKDFDWIASPETFETVKGITDTEGASAFYRFYYLKKFGMRMGEEVEYDIMKTGQDVSNDLFALPMMRAMLKGVEIRNEQDPLSVLSGGGDTLFILIPSSPEDIEAAKGRIASLGGFIFYTAKVADVQAIVDTANQMSNMNVSAISLASIMMATGVVITNFESKLVPFDLEAEAPGMTME